MNVFAKIVIARRMRWNIRGNETRNVSGPLEAAPPNAVGEVPEELKALLKRCRTRIAPERASLGPYLRVPARVGKAVSQEEVAEAVAISRQWYALLESGHSVRVSSAVLARIAEALAMDPTERSALFRLAVPELRAASLEDRSTAMLEAFGSLRRLTRPLWAATTEADALTVVREYAMMQFASDAMMTSTRMRDGRWEYEGIGKAYDPDRLTVYQEVLRERWGPTVMDDIVCYRLMAQPGDVLTDFERDARFPDLGARHHQAADVIGWDVSYAMAYIRSRRGFVARLLPVHQTAHAFSELERAHLSALADLTSLALSGCVSSPSRRIVRRTAPTS